MAETAGYALVLTSQPGANALNQAALAAVRPVLSGYQIIEEQWLAADEAWQAVLAREGTVDWHPLHAIIKAALAGRLVDVNIVPHNAACRRKRLLVADMESTMIEQECLDELAALVGMRDHVSAITARAMRGELDFATALTERVALLKGLDASVLEQLYQRITLTPGAETLINTMQCNGAKCALVSGGFTFFTQRIAGQLGFDTHRANTLEIAAGKLTGAVRQPILGREAKLATLTQLQKELGLDAAETLAVGDGANDLAMIKAAGLGVAYRAKPVVAAQAGASIVHGDLTALLYLQGYRREEFVSTGSTEAFKPAPG